KVTPLSGRRYAVIDLHHSGRDERQMLANEIVRAFGMGRAVLLQFGQRYAAQNAIGLNKGYAEFDVLNGACRQPEQAPECCRQTQVPFAMDGKSGKGRERQPVALRRM